MKYHDIYQQREEQGHCPFCNEDQDIYIDENASSFVVPARAPYTKDHILVCSKRHVKNLSELTDTESDELWDMIRKWSNIIQREHEEFVVFLREGTKMGSTGKTLDHLHRHIVPYFQILYADTQESSNKRHFMDEIEYIQASCDLKKLLA